MLPVSRICSGSRDTALRAVLIEQHFPRFSSFSFQEKQETFAKFENLTDGKIFGTRVPVYGKKWKIWKYKKLREKKKLEIRV